MTREEEILEEIKAMDAGDNEYASLDFLHELENADKVIDAETMAKAVLIQNNDFVNLNLVEEMQYLEQFGIKYKYSCSRYYAVIMDKQKEGEILREIELYHVYRDATFFAHWKLASLIAFARCILGEE